MIRRSSRLLLEAIAALTAGFVVLAGFAAWRLSGDEPLRLTFLTPYIEEALTPPDGSFFVAIDDTVLTWGGWERTFDLRATGVRVQGGDGRTVAAVPAVSLTLSIRALALHRLIAPTAVEIFGPRIFLVRDADGRFRFVHGVNAAATQAGDETSPILPTLLQTLLAKPDPALRSGYLVRARVTHGELTFVDKRTGLTWRAPEANITLARDAEGITGRMDMTVERLGNPARLDATVAYDSATRTLSATSRFTGVDASAVAQIDPVLAKFAGARITLSGQLTSSMDLDGRIGATSFDVGGGPGTLTMLDVFEAPLDIQRLSLRASFDPIADRLTVAEADLQFDGPRLSATGRFDGLHAGFGGSRSDLRIEAKATAENVDMASLSRYWPAKVRPNARAWITTHVTAGHVAHVEADIGVTLPGGSPSEAKIERLSGTMAGDQLTVHYLDPLPLVEGAAGLAHFTQQSFNVDFSTGHVQEIQIDGGSVQVKDLDQHDQTIDIDGRLHGPLAAALAVLDNPRLGYAKKLGLSPADVSGRATATLSFSFPAIHSLTFDQVKVTAAADVAGAHVGNAMLGQDVDDGAVKLKLDRQGMTMAGSAKFGGAPIKFQWDENFGKADFTRRISASGPVSAAQRAAMGFDYRPMLDGPVDADVVFTRLPKQRAKVDLKLGLGDATLRLPLVHWEKAAGTPGDARVAIDLVGDRVVAIPGFSVAAADLAASGQVRFDPDNGSLSGADFDKLQVGRTNLHGVVVDFANKRTDITVAGGTIDAGPLLKRDEKKVAASETAKPAFSFQAKHLDQIIVDADSSLSDVSLSLRHDGRYWDEILLNATLPEKQPLSVSYEPDNGKHRLSITSADAGAALRAFDIIDTVKGGKLNITGSADDGAPNRPLTGKAVIKDFRLVRAPVLARLLTMATLTGFVDILTGEGFQFDRFVSDFTKTDGRIDIKLARAHGPSIGLTGTGTIDFDQRTVNMAGTVVPAYALNSILGNIPIIGELLQGGPGEGMFAATYHATGALDHPDIAVNPLAALTPGFLRGMFEIFDSGKSGDASGDKSPPATALPDAGTSK